ncbi:MAG: LysR family transcriptional regulator [Acidobacteria bacterium]|nr:LysR family transcriptional regulator [Acidobacteriota bacterium]
MARDDLSALAAFLTVAEERSFTKAAAQLGVSPSALSHAVQKLEERLGVRLLARTTRSVSPTDAGERLMSRLAPALADVRGAWEEVAGLGGDPRGRVRLIASRLAARMVLTPRLAAFARSHPGVVIDVTTTEESRVDLVGSRYDAGIQLGEFVAKDMVAVRVSPQQRGAVVASPEYFASRPKPTSPRDLTAHHCINFRHGASGVYRWEFEKGRKSLAVGVDGPLVVDDVEMLIRAALDGVGLAWTLESQAAPHLQSGALVRVLEDWCPPFPGYFLYYPSRKHQPAPLTALINALRTPPT